MSCQAMVGTPPVDWTFSRSISCMAGSASQRRISTILPPAFMVGPSVADSPVAWKKGTTSRVTRCGSLCGSLSGRGSPAGREVGGGGLAGRPDVGGHVAVRAERALGPAGGAGGVEDGGVVLGPEVHVRQGLVGQL